eukprot:5934050-Pleurochrysis_carterae.AAC.1
MSPSAPAVPTSAPAVLPSASSAALPSSSSVSSTEMLLRLRALPPSLFLLDALPLRLAPALALAMRVFLAACSGAWRRFCSRSSS